MNELREEVKKKFEDKNLFFSIREMDAIIKIIAEEKKEFEQRDKEREQGKRELIDCMIKRVKEAEDCKDYLEEEVCLSEWQEAVQDEIKLIEKHTGKKIEEIIK